MPTTVTFGEQQSRRICLGEHTILRPDDAELARPASPASAIRRALAAPTEFPPLARAVIPGDRVAIAIGNSIPRIHELAAGAVAGLVEAGIEPSAITVLTAPRVGGRSTLADQLPAEHAAGVRFEVHDPDDDESMAAVGTTAAGRTLRINRRLVEADFVLPIALAQAPAREGDAPDRYNGLFPEFGNRRTNLRLSSRTSSPPRKRRARRTAEANEAGWLLGVGMTVAVVPGPGCSVAEVIAGDAESVARLASKYFQLIWERSAPRPGDLVIAVLAGDAESQTWGNLARAVAAAARVTSPDGAIAVCCELDAPPSGSFDELLDAVDYADVARRLRQDNAPDAAQARTLALALARGPLYLQSRLSAETVESLGITPIENDVELSRLAAGREHSIIIEEAQRVRPRLDVPQGR